MIFPVIKGAEWSDTWGAPRSGGRKHAGQDLMAPKMRPLARPGDRRIESGTGTALSPPFPINYTRLRFRIGGAGEIEQS
jgi:hypothetical protein